ncbi:ATP-dependent DNA helicase [Parvibaculum sedimenti]|uniref:ATP-dependent DNA helicase n=1 Tax=Parvibaculum sedimenti TaxID=2608632 RepID=A0A6N6VKV7_9HYPH|nr:ATP-dependent DNA helicase [Parvibaculum sedimenti]KAB7741260.1 ATP-dependent DNA helicase [Parvibaculum sedimenti]
MALTPSDDSADFRSQAAPVLPDAAALVPARIGAGAGSRWGALAVTADGEVEELSAEKALERLARDTVLVVHPGFTARRIAVGLANKRGFSEPGPKVLDLLELFAFVHPAAPCLPTPGGLARALRLNTTETPEAQALMLHEAAARLLSTLQSRNYPDRSGTARVAWRMAEAGWAWAPGVMSALGDVVTREGKPRVGRGFDVWNDLPEWEDRAPRGAPGQMPVTEDEARERLAELVGTNAEKRSGQSDFAAATARAFGPREAAGAPNIVIAEAGTGIGKTLGYIAPASLWAQRNKGTVWLSTYTKNLQRQLDQELSRLYPDPAEKNEKTVIRKGRENYLCLLNFAETADRAALSGNAVAIGLVSRWAKASRDGDMVGGDFPAWLAQKLGGGGGRSVLTDRRGECVYTACPHFKKCFIEKAIRKARRADIVVANHALVMRQAALEQAGALLMPQAPRNVATNVEAAGNAEDEEPTGREARSRFVFDEGHHIFDAADSAFSAHLSASETAELRRWIRGAEGQRGRRGRGLEDRIGDLTTGDETAEEALSAAINAASALPAPGWASRLNDGAPRGAAEEFLALLRNHVHARAEDSDGPFSLEAEIEPLSKPIEETARALDVALERLAAPLFRIAERLRIRLDAEAEDLDTSMRIRMDAAARGLERRAKLLIPSWRSMLGGLGRPTPEDFVDWFSIDRIGGREADVGMHRHWRDPTIPFAEAVLEPAHGIVIASATLRDRLIDDADADEGWASAEVRTGVTHLAVPARRAFMASPFNYAAQARIFVVRDVSRTDLNQIASAYRELFLAAGGGALGLFTAIHRLRAVHERLMAPLEEAGLSLYSQHVDALDTSTLVDIFRAERHACLLGTDAVRDGVDVPGDSLRMIVFDRVPWPRPDILHKARRERFGGPRYDDMLTRLRLKQAFGRLIRSARDKGVFIMLDSRLPTRLTSAFPPDVTVERVGLAEAVAGTREFLKG